jgi:hypothetical protein
MKKIEYRSINGNDVFDAPANTLKIIGIFGILGAWIQKPFIIMGFFGLFGFPGGGGVGGGRGRKAESAASLCIRSPENQNNQNNLLL